MTAPPADTPSAPRQTRHRPTPQTDNFGRGGNRHNNLYISRIVFYKLFHGFRPPFFSPAEPVLRRVSAPLRADAAEPFPRPIPSRRGRNGTSAPTFGRGGHGRRKIGRKSERASREIHKTTRQGDGSPKQTPPCREKERPPLRRSVTPMRVERESQRGAEPRENQWGMRSVGRGRIPDGNSVIQIGVTSPTPRCGKGYAPPP